MDKILVVDDEIINLMMVKKILGDIYEVETAASGEDALEKILEFEPTLILLDIHMMGIDGYETLIRIRQIEKMKDIPVIFLSADDESDAEIRGFELGADDFIRKPFVSAVVKRRVERSIESFRLRCNLQSEVERQTEKAEQRRKKLEVLSVEIIQTLATAIDAKDIYTKGHSARVAEYAAILARSLGWDESRIELLRYKALLHDVGKIGVPDRVLNKNGKLTEEEFAIIKSHTTIGAEILKGVSSLENMYQIAKYHHERYDGNGYPEGLAMELIPEEARLIGIADAYDAMSSDRVYRRALSREVIRDELIKGKGTQFDPKMLEKFLELFENEALSLTDHSQEIAKQTVDIPKIIENILSENNFKGAMKLSNNEMAQIYKYINNIHERYGTVYNTVLISLTWEGEIQAEDIEQAMKAMEYSIVQSLRKIDVTTKVSDSQYLIVLTEAHLENISIIIERIFTGFYRNSQNMKIKPVYEIK